MEEEIDSLKSTILELRGELELAKDCKNFDTVIRDPTSIDAKRCLREEVMKHMEIMLREYQSNRSDKNAPESDLKECIGYVQLPLFLD